MARCSIRPCPLVTCRYADPLRSGMPIRYNRFGPVWAGQPAGPLFLWEGPGGECEC